MAVVFPETYYLSFLYANVTQPFALMLHAKVQTNSEYNYAIVMAQNNKMKK